MGLYNIYNINIPYFQGLPILFMGFTEFELWIIGTERESILSLLSTDESQCDPLWTSTSVYALPSVFHVHISNEGFRLLYCANLVSHLCSLKESFSIVFNVGSVLCNIKISTNVCNA